MEINDLYEELSYKEIFPCDIKKLQIFQRRYDSQCIILLYFDHKSRDCHLLNDLKDIKSKIPDDEVKCANCGEQHTANFI